MYNAEKVKFVLQMNQNLAKQKKEKKNTGNSCFRIIKNDVLF